MSDYTESNLQYMLSSSDRLTILSELKKEKLRLTQLAVKLSATVQETSRHLKRLSKAKLIEKESTSLYHLTSFGKLSLELLPSFTFLSANRRFLLSHDLTLLPKEFVQRLSDLIDQDYFEHTGELIRTVDQIISETKEYFFAIGDEGLGGSHFLDPIVENDVSLKAILNMKYVQGLEEEDIVYLKYWRERDWELRLLDEICVGLALNEKMAMVSFLDVNGKLDFSCGFRGVDTSFHKWCSDLFTYYWNKSQRWMFSF